MSILLQEDIFGNKSNKLVKNYAENLGFNYISATNKAEFEKVYEKFICKDLSDKSIIFEVFYKQY